jgi:catechol 2,3-dioxygenase-like lactoylglutathione lyase family enzyme
MAEVRHISYRAEDVDAMAKFFVDAMGMTVVQKRKDNSIDLSDGSVNIAILPLAANRSRRAGLDHIGFSAEDGQEQIRRMEAAGATEESSGRLTKKSLKVLGHYYRCRPLARLGTSGKIGSCCNCQ